MKEGKNEAMDAFERRITDHAVAVEVWKGAKRYAELLKAKPDQSPKYGQGWLNHERTIRMFAADRGIRIDAEGDGQTMTAVVMPLRIVESIRKDMPE